jgi:hypothetical protein
MKLYEFDPETGKYLGSHEAEVDEWQTKIKGETCYVGEANTVWEAPPEQEGCTAYLMNGEWELRPNPTLDELKAAKLAEVKTWTENQIVGGFASECTGATVKFDSDKETQLTMQGIALNVNTELFVTNYPSGCPCRGYAEGSNIKTVYMLNPEQVLRWCADLSMHIGNCKIAGWAKQAEVEAAQSAAELEAITL